MILYCNLKDIRVDDKNYKVQPVLKLTSEKLISNYYSKGNASLQDFYKTNGIRKNDMHFLNLLLQEAKMNNIEIIIENVK